MDRTRLWSTGQVADVVGLTQPSIRRVAHRLGLVPTATPGGHRRFSTEQVATIVQRTGAVPEVPGFTRIQVQVLAAVARHPLGLDSARAVSRAAGVSPTAASSALEDLAERGLVERWSLVTPVAGRAQEQLRWRLRVAEPWLRVAGAVSRAVLPSLPPGPTPARVPRRFWHLFWNADPGSLRVAEHAPYIATRLVLSRETAARAWALLHLPREALEAAARNRAADDTDRALIRAVAG